jgi:octaheme c-type cytochrome (tetrathionate reductase family)
MKAKPMAARPAVLFYIAVASLSLLLFPMTGLAKSDVTVSFEKSQLMTTADFVAYAEANEVDIHDLFFSLRPYEGTGSCLTCHEEEGAEMLETGHFKWAGETDNIVGLEGEVHGKNDLINNFCIANATNEPRCTQCHAGYGYRDASYDFEDPLNVDCLVCHDQSGTYKKAPTLAGLPDPSVDLQAVVRSITIGSKPTRKACINCHAKAGGGDNVKHGDISTDMIATTREFDVHMGSDGADFSCVACHAAKQDQETGNVIHGIAGMSLHSVNEGEMRQCSDCHGSQEDIHTAFRVQDLFENGWHERLACQVCHIPAIARAVSTKTEWYWSDAGQDIDLIPVDPESGRPTYDKKKGTFVWSYDVRPTLRYSNGKWDRKVVGANDGYDEVPISLGNPVGDHSDPDAMIFPFKLMIGNQPVDPVNKTVLVPHLYGKDNGPSPYWGGYDWVESLIDGAVYTGQEFSGTHAFEDTTMLLSVNHEIAPADDALGNYGCIDCHGSRVIDWQALGWSGDPLMGGKRVEAGEAMP